MAKRLYEQSKLEDIVEQAMSSIMYDIVASSNLITFENNGNANTGYGERNQMMITNFLWSPLEEFDLDSIFQQNGITLLVKLLTKCFLKHSKSLR